MSRQVITSRADILTFGKFKGKTISEVLDKSPSYLIWLHEQGIVEFPADIIESANWAIADSMPPEDYYWQPE